MVQCYFCKGELKISHPVGRDEICTQCHRDVRCCLNCRFYDPRVSNQCRETQREPVGDRSRSNFCEFFRCRDEGGDEQDGQSRENARAAWDRLFRK